MLMRIFFSTFLILISCKLGHATDNVTLEEAAVSPDWECQPVDKGKVTQASPKIGDVSVDFWIRSVKCEDKTRINYYTSACKVEDGEKDYPGLAKCVERATKAKTRVELTDAVVASREKDKWGRKCTYERNGKEVRPGIVKFIFEGKIRGFCATPISCPGGIEGSPTDPIATCAPLKGKCQAAPDCSSNRLTQKTIEFRETRVDPRPKKDSSPDEVLARMCRFIVPRNSNGEISTF